jgi:Phage integrase family
LRKKAEESSFRCFVDAQGRYADFHALRKTFITNLSKSGVSPKMAQSLARHSDINLTMNVYTDVVLQDQAIAVALLPELPPFLPSPAPIKASGIHQHLATIVPTATCKPRTSSCREKRQANSVTSLEPQLSTRL